MPGKGPLEGTSSSPFSASFSFACAQACSCPFLCIVAIGPMIHQLDFECACMSTQLLGGALWYKVC